jgi:hypothetical protein
VTTVSLWRGGGVISADNIFEGKNMKWGKRKSLKCKGEKRMSQETEKVKV